MEQLIPSIGRRIPGGTGIVALGFCLALLAGCASETMTGPERTWEEVRYHWIGTDEATYGDVVVHATGDMLWDLQGLRVPARGLLTGENLETLTRLIGALPPAGYRAAGAPDGAASFLSLRIGGEVRTYATYPDDAAAPPALREIGAQLESWAEETTSHRRDPVDFRVLVRGEKGGAASESRQVVPDRDALLALLQRLGDAEPGILPRVDFSREFVVAIFLGSRPTGGYAVDVSQVLRSEGGQIVVQEIRIQPGPGCAATQEASSPFVLVAIGVPYTGNADLLFEAETIVTDCPGEGGTP